MPLARHILVTISESLYTVYIRSNDEVINGALLQIVGGDKLIIPFC